MPRGGHHQLFDRRALTLPSSTTTPSKKKASTWALTNTWPSSVRYFDVPGHFCRYLKLQKLICCDFSVPLSPLALALPSPPLLASHRQEEAVGRYALPYARPVSAFVDKERLEEKRASKSALGRMLNLPLLFLSSLPSHPRPAIVTSPHLVIRIKIGLRYFFALVLGSSLAYLQLLGVPSARGRPPCFPPFAPRQGSPSRVQGQAGLPYLPRPCPPR